MKISLAELKEIIKETLDEVYKSKKQMRLFHALAAKKGKEGKKWKKLAKRWDEESRGKISKLPEEV
jgi:hypothetical protein